MDNDQIQSRQQLFLAVTGMTEGKRIGFLLDMQTDPEWLQNRETALNRYILPTLGQFAQALEEQLGLPASYWEIPIPKLIDFEEVEKRII